MGWQPRAQHHVSSEDESELALGLAETVQWEAFCCAVLGHVSDGVEARSIRLIACAAAARVSGDLRLASTGRSPIKGLRLCTSGFWLRQAELCPRLPSTVVMEPSARCLGSVWQVLHSQKDRSLVWVRPSKEGHLG